MDILNFIFGTGHSNKNIAKIISAAEFKNHITNNKVQLIDVRTALEFSQGAIKGAKNINYFSSSFTSECKKLNTEKPLFLYCKSGNRSKKAAQKITALGFKEIYDLQGGYQSW